MVMSIVAYSYIDVCIFIGFLVGTFEHIGRDMITHSFSTFFHPGVYSYYFLTYINLCFNHDYWTSYYHISASISDDAVVDSYRYLRVGRKLTLVHLPSS